MNWITLVFLFFVLLFVYYSFLHKRLEGWARKQHRTESDNHESDDHEPDDHESDTSSEVEDEPDPPPEPEPDLGMDQYIE